MFIEQVNPTMANFAKPINPNVQPDFSSPVMDRRDLGTGTQQFRVEGSKKRAFALTTLMSPSINDNGTITLQLGVGATVKVTTMPTSHIQQQDARLVAGGSLDANLWKDVVCAANDIVTLPDNVSGLYIDATGGAVYGVIRRV